MTTQNPANRAQLEELKRLLLGPEQERLKRLAERLENPEAFAREVSEILPRAMIKSAQLQGEELSRAMIPTVEDIVRMSVQKDINRFADVLFPVIGPAIRKSIKETMRQMMQTLNNTLENSLSWQGLRWRFEAYRTGIAFAEIALLHALVYRVEQVFLIHRDSGLLLCELGREDIDRQDPELVSAMLSAINDFIGDSFVREESSTLDRVEVGELSIWIEAGPQAILALAIRGEAPASLRTTMQVTLERIQSGAGDALAEFAGDTSAFESLDDILQDCLQAQFAPPKPLMSAKTVVFMLLALVLAFAWIGHTWWQWSLRDDAITIFRQEPGYVITATEQDGDLLLIDGLRDPLARPPQDLLLNSPLEASRVVTRLAPYQSLAKDFVARRARRILQPPDSVEMTLHQARLTVSGEVDRAWRDQLLARLPLITGIDSLDDSGLRIRFTLDLLSPPPSVQLSLEAEVLYVTGSSPQAWIETLAAVPTAYPEIDSVDTRALINLSEVELLNNINALEQETVLFGVANAFDLNSFDAPRISALAKKIIAGANELSLNVLIILRGYSDSVGNFEDNRLLSVERANHVARALLNTGISPRYIAIRGLEAPIIAETGEAERRFNRRVNFEVVVEAANGA